MRIIREVGAKMVLENEKLTATERRRLAFLTRYHRGKVPGGGEEEILEKGVDDVSAIAGAVGDFAGGGFARQPVDRAAAAGDDGGKRRVLDDLWIHGRGAGGAAAGAAEEDEVDGGGVGVRGADGVVWDGGGRRWWGESGN